MSWRQHAEERRRAERVHQALTDLAERSSRPAPPRLYPSRVTMMRAVLASFGDAGRAVLCDPLGLLIRAAVTVKVAACVMVIVALPLVLLFVAR